MTYHHLNRLIAHSNAELAPNERLLAWHFAYQTRAKENTYSQSLRRLESDLELNERTIRRALNRLVDLGLFERIDRTGVYAPIYRLLVSCPISCGDLEDHNTKQELAVIWERNTLPPTNTPTLNSNQTPPYIEKREEEEGFTSKNWKVKILGVIRKALAEVKDKTEDHFTLLGFTETRPSEVIEAALEITQKAGLNTWKRIEPYLATTTKTTPQNLLVLAEQVAFTEEGFRALSSGNNLTETTPKVEYLAGHRSERLAEFRVLALAESNPELDLKTFIDANGWKALAPKTRQVEDGFLAYWASKDPSKITKEVLNLFRKCEGLLLNAYNLAGIEPNFSFIPDFQNNPEQVELNFQEFPHLEDIEGFLTEEETEIAVARREAINEHKTNWRIANSIEGDYTPAQFWQDPETRKVLAANPEPLTQEEKVARITSKLRELILPMLNREIVFAYEDQFSYQNFLKKFTWQEDLKEFLEIYPARPEGNQDFKKTASAFLSIRRFITQEGLELSASMYKQRLGDTYPKNASNWLQNLEEELKGVKVNF